MSEADETRDGVALTNLDQPLFDGADATKRDLVDYLDAVARPDPPGAARPAAVGDPGPPRPAAVHAEEPAQVHPGLGAAGRRSGRRRPTGRSRTPSATTGAPCSGSPTSGRWSTTRRWSPWRTCTARPTWSSTSTRRTGDALPRGGRRAPCWSARRSPTPGWPARSRPAAPRACTSSCRSTDERHGRGRGRRHPGARRPRRAARPGARHHGVHPEDRDGKVFLDSTRAGGATVVAAYSPRVRPGVPVSFPVDLGRPGPR